MHLALLPALIVALLTGTNVGLFSSPNDTAPVARQGYATNALYSIAAQATATVTTTTDATPTTTTTDATATVSPTATATDAGAEATATITEPGSPTAAADITATLTTTATEGTDTGAIVTATSPVTGTQTAPPPVETAVPQATFQGNFLDPQFLFSAPPPGIPMGPLAWGYFALMLGLLGASIYFYVIKRPRWKSTNSVHYRAANTWGQAGLWVGALGLLFLLFRVIRLDFFNLRFWLYLWMLVTLGLAAWFFYWYRTSYPKQMAKYRKVQRARQYMPGTTAKASVRQPTKTSTRIETPPRAKERPAQTPAGSTGSTSPSQKASGGKRRKKK